MPNVSGGGLSMLMFGNNFVDSVSCTGNRVTELVLSATVYPIMRCTILGPGIGDPDSSHFRNIGPPASALGPDYATSWIFYSWDLKHLAATYGQAPTTETTVHVQVKAAVTMSTAIEDGSFPSGTTSAHDLIACVPPDVQVPADLSLQDTNGRPYSEPFYGQLAVDPAGGERAWPARPFPAGFGSGAWTQLATYRATNDIKVDPQGAAGWWVIPVDFDKHAHRDKLVIVCAQAALFTQDDALCSEVVEPFMNNSEFATNERWVTAPFAYLNYGGLDTGLLDGRAHFFRGGAGEVPIGVAGEVDSSGALTP